MDMQEMDRYESHAGKENWFNLPCSVWTSWTEGPFPALYGSRYKTPKWTAKDKMIAISV